MSGGRNDAMADPSHRLLGIGAPLWAAIYLGVAAATLPAVLPVMVGVLTDKLAFGLERAGYVASANMGGIAVGSIIGAALTRRWSWRTVILLGSILLIAANLLTMTLTSFPAMALMRFAAGFGEGLMAGICYAAMGRSGQATRALAFYVAGQGLVGAVGMGLMPSLVERAGWPWLFLVTTVVALPAFWLATPIATLNMASDLPAAVDKGLTPTTSAAPAHLGWTAVAMLLLQFIGMSSIWAFLERLGHAKGLDSTHLSLALSISAIVNMLASLLVGLFSQRIRGIAGSGAAFVLFVGSVAVAFLSVQWQAYAAAAALFMVAWAVYFPLQFGVLATFDPAGRLAAITPAVTGLGFTIGPALGGLFMARGGTGAILGLGLACVLGSTLGAMTLQLKGDRPT